MPSTPYLLLDEARLQRNLERMRARTRELGVPLRPHAKTAKSVPVLERVFEGGRGPITVSTLREAEYFAGAGFTDILYAVGIVGDKLERVHALQRAGVRLTLLLDSVAQVEALQAAAARKETTFPFLIEIDSDGHRAGIKAESDALLAIATSTSQVAGAELQGVLTHAGASYFCRGEEAMRAMAAQERDAVLLAARRLRDAGFRCELLSVGSTPTALFADHLDGISELRAGVYMFMDLVMVGLGVCAVDDIALGVRCSVIGHQREKGWLITDGGWMALSRDRGTADQPVDHGYGLVRGVAEELVVFDANQEHGMIAGRGGQAIDCEAYPIGSQLVVLPNHACATAAMHDFYELVGPGPGRWERIQGW